MSAMKKNWANPYLRNVTKNEEFYQLDRLDS